MAIIRTSRKLHKWLMLFIGTQMLIWAATGTYMVVMDIDYIHGDSLVIKQHTAISSSQVQFSLADLQRQFPKAERISLKMLQGQLVYQFRAGKSWRLIDANRGTLLAAINKQQAQVIAKRLYSDQSEITNTLLLTEPNGEISPRILPAWQINFADFGSPRLYISAQTGELVTKRHSFWVMFDWLFRFHIMDYGEEEDAGNRLLLFIALTSLLACITGVILTYVSFIKVRGKSIKPPKSRNSHNKKKKIRIMPWIRFFHRWLSILVFTQLLIWISTGLYFNLMDHQKASGDQHRQRVDENTKQFAHDEFFPLRKVLQQFASIEKISVISRLDNPYYLLTFKHGLYSHFPRLQKLIDAKTGQLENIDSGFVQSMAQLSYKGNAIVKSAQIYSQTEELPKQQNPLWRINFNDKLSTSVYVDAQNASVIGHVDDDKRLADFMFKLHFMDYKILSDMTGGKVGSFNNAQIIFFALLTLLFSLTGVYWLLHLVKHKQFRY
ncbi:MAG: hypothetical protein COB35_01435 [Gammaproteobacteria bacterium]|nr:MAG: hypothetical protein COB35_01435 [Gammaproteobacteria bacterium]